MSPKKKGKKEGRWEEREEREDKVKKRVISFVSLSKRKINGDN